MKLNTIINYAGWVTGIFGALLMLAGVIGFLTGTEFIGVKNYFNYFYMANSFLFLGIFLLLGSSCCCNHSKDEGK